jgi:SsrA-binding protein
MSAKKGKDANKAGAPSAVNKKAYHNFELVEKVEAGLALTGSEVKSLREGRADLSGSYARLDDNGEVWLVGVNINQYEQAGIYNHDPLRKRKILLHRQQIRRIQVKLEQRGFTFVPLRIYFNDRGLAKVELALARGKKQFDKRATITEKQQKRDLDRDAKKYR